MSDSEKPEDIPAAPHAAAHGGAEEGRDPNGPVNTDYEDNDIHLKTVKKFVAGSFAVTVAFFVLMLIVHRFYKKDFASDRGVATAEERQIPSKDESLLQTDELKDLAAYVEQEEERLNMTKDAGEHAVIPVAAAKQLMVQEGFPHSQVAAEGEEPMAEAPEEGAMEAVAAVVAVPEEPQASAEPQAMQMAETPALPAEPEPDPVFIAEGKKIWEQQCMAACHTGKRGAIAPNIQKAYGTMRKLEGGEEILMDTAYVINSMNHPNEHIAKGYMPVMMSFKDVLTDTQKEQVAAYLRSQGKPIPVSQPTSAPTPVVEPAPTPAPVVEPVTPPAAPAPQPQPETPKAPVQPAPAKPAAPAGTIFV